MALTTYVSGCVTTVANTKGAYIQTVASTPYASSRMYVLPFVGSSYTLTLFDIAKGAASSETVVISNIAVAAGGDSIFGSFTPIEIDIPAGTRISARAQTNNPSTLTHYIITILEDRAIASIANPVTYGTDLSNNGGTVVDPGGTASTKGAYVQLTASTSADIDSLVICVTGGTAAIAMPGYIQWSLDIATGAASSESIIIPDLLFVNNTAGSSGQVMPPIITIPISIPAGTRIAVRCNCTLNTTVVRLLRVSVIGMQQPTVSAGSNESVQFSVVSP